MAVSDEQMSFHWEDAVNFGGCWE